MEYDEGAHAFKCPKCDHGMEEVSHDGIVIERCTHCQGLWFDTDEVDQLRSSEGGHALDTGDPEEGWKWDTVDEVDCPHCGKKMEKTAAEGQRHIWIEVCHEHGMFLDAGEFTDYKDKTLLDFFRGLIKGTRHETL